MIGVSGALVFTDNGTFCPLGGKIQSPWFQGLIVPANGCLIPMKTDLFNIDDLQINDTFRVSGAAGTAYVRFGEPAVDDYGGNSLTGWIPGDNEGLATSIGTGVVVAQSGNRIDGIKGYRGNNVVIAVGVDYTYAVLGGSVVGSAAAGIVDNSGTATNTCMDYVATPGRIYPR